MEQMARSPDSNVREGMLISCLVLLWAVIVVSMIDQFHGLAMVIYKSGGMRAALSRDQD